MANYMERVIVTITIGSSSVTVDGYAQKESIHQTLTEIEISNKAKESFRDALKAILNARRKIQR
jgi:hypothetical protein